ncbi:MAG: hypothetical protein WBA73_15750 [Devosia sp.]
MITAVAADPVQITSSAMASYRTRSGAGERSMLPESAPPTPRNAGAGENGTFPRQERPTEPAPEQQNSVAASMFAAAVIAGALPPVPTTMEELIMRIGAIPIPPESEARLKDLLA